MPAAWPGAAAPWRCSLASASSGCAQVRERRALARFSHPSQRPNTACCDSPLLGRKVEEGIP